MARLPKYAIYERCVAALAVEREERITSSVMANARIRGILSGRSRQIDVVIEDLRFSPKDFRVIVDAKCLKRKIDVPRVEAFEGVMRDVQASHGVLVVSSGITPAALRRAQDSITIAILPYEDAVQAYDWQFEPCLDGCGADGDIGMVLWGTHKVCGLGPGWFMYRAGKCSHCGAFHVWCGDCGTHLSIPDGRLSRCSCEDREWGAIPESKQSGHSGEPESTWLMLQHAGEFTALDRKPLGSVKRQIDIQR